MVNGWYDVGQLVAARREDVGFKTQLELATAIGVSVSTIGSVERGIRQGRHSPSLFDKIERAIGWTPGSIRRAGEGGRPTLLPDPYLARVRFLWPQLTEQGKRGVVRYIEDVIG